MKIGILTHYQVINHGALLQLHALRSVLENMGHEVYPLTYNKNYDFRSKDLGPSPHGKSLLQKVPVYISYLKKHGLAASGFRYKKENILKKYRQGAFSFKNLYAGMDTLDAVCIGSDEVFSLEAGVNIMMYSHTVTTPKIIAYAPSFGQTDIERIKEYGCEELIKSGLGRFTSLSVRDNASFNTVKTLTGKEPPIVCDPVLLYDFKKEFSRTKTSFNGQKYLLIYSYDTHMNCEEEIAPIKAYAKKHGLKTVSAGFYHKWCDYCLNIDPMEILALWQGAQAVVTDTFHGTILSVITNKPFAAFVRGMNTNKMTSLLESAAVSHLKLNSFNNLEQILSQKTDWKTVNQAVLAKRQEGIDYLKKALENGK